MGTAISGFHFEVTNRMHLHGRSHTHWNVFKIEAILGDKTVFPTLVLRI